VVAVPKVPTHKLKKNEAFFLVVRNPLCKIHIYADDVCRDLDRRVKNFECNAFKVDV
jgi:hypothetical protein